jgi:multimeric flavodoxin WrbA
VNSVKIAAIHGQMHKGSTYNITKLFIDKLMIIDKSSELKEFFLPKDGPGFCTGCFNCFTKGEEYCFQAEKVQDIVRYIEEADLIILESPCYVMGMSGQLKAFLDHMAYRWMSHRPYHKMFGKVGLVISTAAGTGTKKVNKSLKDNLFFLGVPKVYSYGKNVAAANWTEVKEEKKVKIDKEVSKMSLDIYKKISKVKPGIKMRFMFKIMQLSQKSNTWNPADKEYWARNGWLNGGKPWRG